MECDAFRTILDELLAAKEKSANDMGRMSEIRSNLEIEKRRIISLGEKLYAAANAVRNHGTTTEFAALCKVLQETSREFDEIPF